MPKISAGESRTSTAAEVKVTIAGNLTLPAPRSAAASRLTIQLGTAPAKTKPE